jgi:hypothetical protein
MFHSYRRLLPLDHEAEATSPILWLGLSGDLYCWVPEDAYVSIDAGGRPLQVLRVNCYICDGISMLQILRFVNLKNIR